MEFQVILCDIYKWLWNSEIYYKNRLTDIQNNFNSHGMHTINDFMRLSEAERDYNNFLKFSHDLNIILKGISYN